MTDQTDKPVAFYDLRRDQFPFRLRLLDEATDEVAWESLVRGPGAIEIPSFAPRKVRAELTYPNGHQFVNWSDGRTEEHFTGVLRY